MTEEKKPRGRPPKGVEVYITAALVKTSKGPMHHGDRVHLPEAEAEELKRKRFAE